MNNDLQPILRVQNLTKDFAGLRAVNEVSFQVKEGEIKGIIGPNGSGKTTIFNMISGVYKPTSGKIFYKEVLLNNLRPSERAKLGIGRTFQIVRPLTSMSVIENVVVPLGINMYKKVTKPFFTFPNKNHLEEAYRLLKLVGLEKYADMRHSELPLAFQRRLEIARSLALKPKLLMLDEPTAGLSIEESNDLMNLILKLNLDGMTILLIEHNMRVVMNISESIMVLNHGKKICEGTPEKVKSDPEVIEAYFGR
jgi:branched-chain amino acid transport system ATP-binding protein